MRKMRQREETGQGSHGKWVTKLGFKSCEIPKWPHFTSSENYRALAPIKPPLDSAVISLQRSAILPLQTSTCFPTQALILAWVIRLRWAHTPSLSNGWNSLAPCFWRTEKGHGLGLIGLGESGYDAIKAICRTTRILPFFCFTMSLRTDKTMLCRHLHFNIIHLHFNITLT